MKMTPDRICQVRRWLGMSQAEFAAHLGLASRSMVCMLESGRREPKGPLLRLLELVEAQAQASPPTPSPPPR